MTERVICITRTTALSSLDDHLRYARLVTDMISLGQGKCLSFTTRSAKFAVVSQDWFGRSADLFVEIPPSPGDESGTSDSEMLFTFSDIRDRLSTILNSWFQCAEEYQATYNLYFAAARSSTIYPQHRLFNYYHALEAYHRQRYRGKLVTNKKAGSRVTTQERLLDLVMLLDCSWIFQDIDISVERIVSLRNQQVHSGDKIARAADPLELLNAGSALQVFCELVFLGLLGFAVDEANALLKIKGRLRRLHYRLA